MGEESSQVGYKIWCSRKRYGLDLNFREAVVRTVHYVVRMLVSDLSPTSSFCDALDHLTPGLKQ